MTVEQIILTTIWLSIFAGVVIGFFIGRPHSNLTAKIISMLLTVISFAVVGMILGALIAKTIKSFGVI